MHKLLILVFILFLTSCSVLQKPKVKEVLSEVTNAVEVLNTKYCRENNELFRQILISQIRHYVPFYPDEGYCLFVGDVDVK